MSDEAGELRDAVRAELAKDAVRGRLLRLALWRSRVPADAEDLVQDALRVVSDPVRSPWKPGTGASFFLCVGSIVNGLAANARRSWFARAESLEARVEGGKEAPDSGALPDDVLDAHRALAHLRALGRELQAHLEATDRTAAAVYRAAMEGAEGHAELAARAECSTDDIGRSYDRIRYYANKVRERHEAAEKQRMSEIRSQPGARGVKHRGKETAS